MKKDLSVSESGTYVSQGAPAEDTNVFSASRADEAPDHILHTPAQGRRQTSDPMADLRKAARRAPIVEEPPKRIPTWAWGGLLALVLAGGIALGAVAVSTAVWIGLSSEEPEQVEEGERRHRGIPVRGGLGKD